MVQRLLLQVLLAVSAIQQAQGFTAGPISVRSKNGHDHHRVVEGVGSMMHMATSAERLSSASSSSALNLMKNGEQEERTRKSRLSQSVLSSHDIPPSVPMAHGLLCPETVERMDEATNHGSNNPAVAKFLDRYRSNGPMSCVDMLSDPEVLPHLTKALRNVL